MQRTEVVVRAAIPMAVMNTLLWMAVSREFVSESFLLWMSVAAYFGGASAARKLQATWREIVLGFVVALAPLFILEPALAFISVLYGGAGLLLLPLLSKAVRAADESVAVPPRSVYTWAWGALGVLAFIFSRYMPLPSCIMLLYSFCLVCILPVAVVAGALAVAGQSRIGAWVGTVGATMFWISYGLAWVLSYFIG
ncbi:MAG: hypothetical protein QM758_22350 [Armatimonas sp.]